MKTEIVTFLTQKESQYNERRARVMEYCRGEGRESFSRHVVPFSLLYNTEEGVSVCLIPKVASTTWLGYMAAFGECPNGINCLSTRSIFTHIPLILIENINMSSRLGVKNQLQSLQISRPPTSSKSIAKTWNSEDNLSIVIVRHPYSRLGQVHGWQLQHQSSSLLLQ